MVTATRHSWLNVRRFPLHPQLPRTARLEFGSDSNRLFPLIIVRNVHIYPGVPQYLQMIFELNKVSERGEEVVGVC